MKKYLFIMLSAMLMVMSAGCTGDDEIIDQRNLNGTWNMVRYALGEGYYQEEFQFGEVTITFDDKSKHLIVENNKGGFFLKSGSYSYKTSTETRRILTYEWVDVEYNVITIQFSDGRAVSYDYRIYNGTLCFDGGMASDGPGYYFKKSAN